MKKILLLMLIGVLLVGCGVSEHETVEMTDNEAIQKGVYKLNDTDVAHMMEINDILGYLKLPHMEKLSFGRDTDWKRGKRYRFEIKVGDVSELFVAYTEDGVVINIRSLMYDENIYER